MNKTSEIPGNSKSSNVYQTESQKERREKETEKIFEDTMIK